MAMTEPTGMPPVITPHRVATPDQDDDDPGWTSRMIRRDPVVVAAMVLIVVQIAWRAKISAGGYLSLDDFVLAIKSTEHDLTFGYLTSHFNNHMLPAGYAFTWVVTRAVGYAYWPYLLFMLTVQALASVVFFRVLRQLVPARWGVLIPLTIFLFTPLNMETTSWWAFGMLMLPMQLAMIWAIGAMANYVHTRRGRHLVSLTLAFLFGLAFGEKAMLILPLLFGLTACLLVRGGPGRSIWRTLTRFWPAWVILAGIGAPYAFVYFQRAEASLRRPDSLGQVTQFAQQFFTENLVPGLAGGPWQWYEQLPAASPELKVLSLIALVVLIVVTVWRRPPAARAWLLAGGYTFLAAALIAATRLGHGDWSALSGLILRYSSDAVVVVVLCMAVALFGVRQLPDRKPPRQLPGLDTPAAKVFATAVVLTLFVIGSAVSTSGYEKRWASQPARDYLKTVESELAKAPPGKVFLDRLVPPGVVSEFSAPYNKQSKFFAPLKNKPVFVTQAESPSVFDDSGHIKLAAVVRGVPNVMGPEPDCGYRIKGGSPAVAIPMGNSLWEWVWVLRIAYTSTGSSPVEVRTGGQLIGVFDARPGTHPYHLAFVGEVGKVIEVKVVEPGIEICTNDLRAGELVPWIE